MVLNSDEAGLEEEFTTLLENEPVRTVTYLNKYVDRVYEDDIQFLYSLYPLLSRKRLPVQPVLHHPRFNRFKAVLKTPSTVQHTSKEENRRGWHGSDQPDPSRTP